MSVGFSLQSCARGWHWSELCYRGLSGGYGLSSSMALPRVLEECVGSCTILFFPGPGIVPALVIEEKEPANCHDELTNPQRHSLPIKTQGKVIALLHG